MGSYGDWIIMLLAGGVLLIWLYRSFYRWLHEPSVVSRVKLGKGGELKANDPHVALLEAAGYEVSSGKHVIPIGIELDGMPLDRNSQLYIDYIAELDESMYIVKTARDRSPMDWTASGIRERLLVYSLLLPQCEGVLFVDAKEKSIKLIKFHVF